MKLIEWILDVMENLCRSYISAVNDIRATLKIPKKFILKWQTVRKLNLRVNAEQMLKEAGIDPGKPYERIEIPASTKDGGKDIHYQQ